MKKRAYTPHSKSKGNIMIELSISLIVIGLLAKLLIPTGQVILKGAFVVKERIAISETNNKLLSFIGNKKSIPTSLEFLAVDNLQKNLQDIYIHSDTSLVYNSNLKAPVCQYDKTNLIAEVCTDSLCTEILTIRNVAGVLIYSGENGIDDSLTRYENISSVNTSIIRLRGYPKKELSFNSITHYNDDSYRIVSLYEAKKVAECNAFRMRFLTKKLDVPENISSLPNGFEKIYVAGGLNDITNNQQSQNYSFCIETDSITAIKKSGENNNSQFGINSVVYSSGNSSACLNNRGSWTSAPFIQIDYPTDPDSSIANRLYTIKAYAADEADEKADFISNTYSINMIY